MLLDRPVARRRLNEALERGRVVALIGPRQSGKTTLARTIVPPASVNYFDLEDPASLARLDEPMTALAGLTGVVVIDEVQRRPDLYPILRVLVDREPLPSRFLILGSAAPELLRQPSESLAGRLETIPLAGVTLGDVGGEAQEEHWQRGAFPRSYLAASEAESLAWRQSFVQTFLERDVRELGVGASPLQLRRFWSMVAHYHGQIWNAAEPARSLAISESTVRRYLDLLEAVFMVRQLQPWHASIMKRQVRSPKVYIRDSGLLHSLLGIGSPKELLEHPKVGASWEGYVVEEVLKAVEPQQQYFWATHAGAELDLLLMKDGWRIGVEAKRADAPRMTRSMAVAVDDLHLHRLIVIYPGPREYALRDRVNVVPLEALSQDGDWRAILRIPAGPPTL